MTYDPLLNSSAEWVGIGSLFGTMWLAFQMFWCPYFGEYFTQDYLVPGQTIYPITDYFVRVFDNWYKVSYFFCWITFFFGSFLEAIFFIMTGVGIYGPFYAWIGEIGFYLLVLGGLIPPLLQIFYILAEKEHWTHIKGMVEWNFWGGLIVYIILAIIKLSSTQDALDHMEAVQ
jgi:hypothetical protein